MPLSDPITYELDLDGRKEFLHKLWDASWVNFHKDNYDSWYIFYRDSLKMIDLPGHLDTHEDFIRIAKLISAHVPKEELLMSSTPDIEEKIRGRGTRENAIDFVASMITMIPIRGLRVGIHKDRNWWCCWYESLDGLGWYRGPLRDVLSNHFRQDDTISESYTHTIPYHFRATKFQELGGIQIRWTRNFVNHLRIVDGGQDEVSVSLFNPSLLTVAHRFVSQEVLAEDRTNPCSELLPDFLENETRRTLALLFPCTDTEDQGLLKDLAPAEGIAPNLDGCSLPITLRRLDKFPYWRERLILLKETFDNYQPTTLRGMWRDRRNANQWWTSWIAISAVSLTVFFGLVQSIEGAIQVYKAYHLTPA
jgi:hypothetical protein